MSKPKNFANDFGTGRYIFTVFLFKDGYPSFKDFRYFSTKYPGTDWTKGENITQFIKSLCGKD